MLRMLDGFRALLMKDGRTEGTEAFGLVREAFGAQVEDLKKSAAAGGTALENAFTFCEEAFADGDEVLLFVTELTVNYYSARFVGHYGCDKYYLHNKELQFQERQQEILKRIDEMDWNI